MFYVFSLPPAVYVGSVNLIASIPGPSILNLLVSIMHVIDYYNVEENNINVLSNEKVNPNIRFRLLRM